MAIRVSGQAKLAADFTVELDATEEEFYSLSYTQQNELIKSHVNWTVVGRYSKVDIIKLDDVVKIVE